MRHAPTHSHHGHGHGPGSATRAFALVTLINLAYTAIEAGYGFSTDSLALLSDALHNFGDVLGLGLAWGAAVLARRAPTDRHTYGWRRATLLSPLANALLLVGFAGQTGQRRLAQHHPHFNFTTHRGRRSNRRLRCARGLASRHRRVGG